MNPLIKKTCRTAAVGGLLLGGITGRPPAWASQTFFDGEDARLPNLPLPTLGGLQFWWDEQFFHGWRIQRHFYTGHYRLLDDRNVRRAWGSADECQEALMHYARTLGPMRGEAVIVLHGLLSTPLRMRRIANYLREKGGYTVFNMTYPTTRCGVPHHSAVLRRVVERLDGIERIHFVGHSLGNIVIRHFLAGQAANGGDPRLGRVVMLGPPNNGSEVARFLAERPVARRFFRVLTGECGRQLGCCWSEIVNELTVPPNCEFGVIAGGRGGERGYNPFLPGDNDNLVTVASARLPGARDFIVLPARHAIMMHVPRVQECTLRFLAKGYFVSEESRQPILA